jgi:hypothetical protein
LGPPQQQQLLKVARPLPALCLALPLPLLLLLQVVRPLAPPALKEHRPTTS